MFAELLGRTAFSFLRGASRPEEMVERAHELELGALALCDRDGLYGAVRGFARARDLKLKLVIGAELSLSISGTACGRRGRRKASRSLDTPSVALLARDSEGYGNLCRLLTLSHAGQPKGDARLPLDTLGSHHAGLVAIVPGPAVPEGPDSPPDELLSVLVDVFGPEHAFVAAWCRLDGLDRQRSEWVSRQSKRFGLSVVASARPLYHEPARKPLADVLHCIRTGVTLDEAGIDLDASSAACLRSEVEMRRLFRECEHWVDRASEVAAALHFSLDQIRYDFPCEIGPGETPDGMLARLVSEGAARRYPEGVPGTVQAQMGKELRLIEKLCVAPYFLSTYEVVQMARSRRILCQGRGSAANSAVCYVLGITAVDPARSNLLFERFLSEERSEPPDIDIDFEHERREEVIQAIYQTYGRDRAAMVSEVICYRGKSALREVGKAFGLSLSQVDRLSGTLTHWDSVGEGAKRAGELGLDLRDERLMKVLTIARMLEGFPRHLSIHVGGFVLSAKSLSHVAPVEPARMEGRTVIPWDKDDIEALGFFKIDVLGLGMLTAIRKCLSMTFADGGLRLGPASHGGGAGDDESFDPLDVITRIPAEDPAVYALASQADTVGVFQIESRAQMAMLPRLRPQRFYDLVIEVALVRPGPIQGGMVHPYLRRRNREEEVTAPHPALWPILERTLGVPLFQEQVMQIAIVGAGYTGGEADQLRRDMAAWKKTGRLLRHRQRLLDGFAEKGIPPAFGEALFEQIKGFGDYGFPESHAASFALLVYTSAWQKAHYPAHFVCSLLNSQPMGFYSPSALVRDAQKHGVEVREVSVLVSEWDCSLETAGKGCRIASRAVGARRALRLGLRLVKGLGERAARSVERARASHPFTSTEDLVRRAGLKKNEVEALAESGALEELSRGRRQALWQARAPRTEGLFRDLDVQEPEAALPPLRAIDTLMLDYDRKGLSVHDHPLRHLRAQLVRRGVTSAIRLQGMKRGEKVSVAGLVMTRQRPGTAGGVVFITLEDETGSMNLILYDRVFETHYLAARHAAVLMARGKVERHVTQVREGEVGAATPVIHVIVESLERLDIPGMTSHSRDFH